MTIIVTGRRSRVNLLIELRLDTETINNRIRHSCTPFFFRVPYRTGPSIIDSHASFCAKLSSYRIATENYNRPRRQSAFPQWNGDNDFSSAPATTITEWILSEASVIASNFMHVYKLLSTRYSFYHIKRKANVTLNALRCNYICNQ